MDTESERLFVEFCDASGVQWERIPRSDHRTPDYAIQLQGMRVVCELKQIEQSQDEARALQQAFETGKGVGFFPKNQARRKLKDTAQLKEAARSGLPTMLVLYDKGPFTVGLSHERMVEAMFGETTIAEWLTPDGQSAGPVRRFLGRNKGVTPTQNTSVSAVAVLERLAGELRLRVYHNPHSAIELDSRLLDTLPTVQRFHRGDLSVDPSEDVRRTSAST